MRTMIVKENGNEIVNGNLVFRVLMNRTKLDGFRNETYSKAVSRMEVLKRIFNYSKFEIIIEK